jgi:hypothetical protein
MSKMMEKTEQTNEEKSGLKKRINEDFDIHIIPKKFIAETSPEAQKKSKFVGIMIFTFGLAILFATFGLFYYFIFHYNKGIYIENEIAATSTNESEIESPDATGFEDFYDIDKEIEEEEMIDEEISEDIDDESGTSTDIKRIEHQSGNVYKYDKDSDGDGLYDLEEILLDTDLNSSDTDNDGYPDLSELQNLYNPAGSGRITDNENIAVYKNDIYDYQIFYPKIWRRLEMGGADAMMFEIGNEQMIQIFVQPNIEVLDIEEWYAKQFDEPSFAGQKTDKKGWSGIKSEDGLIYYLTHPNSAFVFTVNYNIGMDNTLYYKNIFKMMVDSLEISR